ncbi:uncharacterized protein F5891DRAFT_1190631 [Suillus fuscotomentosus]|uniref:Uncharacterized protein n=1 Tax=Suillus fuscotomentosus TaxID=1912939 RepID=A0AAD4HJ64_9AGAM|nr:uncharacterized protein F5891DRAFT_1190631 [Suillus fuscotomentosus]KAG1898558.1 hypothetical protein F5891DRAFT_1190631 [Suillus fuscotomentosus]
MTVSKEHIAGVTCYVTIDYAKDKVILLPDAFGVKTPQQLLADDLSETASRFAQTIDKSLDFWGWLAATAKVTRPSLDKVIVALKGRCYQVWGHGSSFSTQSLFPLDLMCTAGRHTLNLAFNNITQCAVVSHLSLLNLPDDLETYFSKSKLKQRPMRFLAMESLLRDTGASTFLDAHMGLLFEQSTGQGWEGRIAPG